MRAEYDKERTAALLKEAQEITSHLKVETEALKRHMARVLDGREAETLDLPEAQKAVTATSGWWFWR
jgi:hypothetical protein